MADLHLHREHTLGLARARKVAMKWAEDVESKLDMECTMIEGDDEDRKQLEEALAEEETRAGKAAGARKPAVKKK
ncbi:MAG: polyhydroxyalkanoic acid system family protein [Burkholderiales bacterium]|nr:polyhydroxyalkanoic acid system family protein [Burkholderiales bacterium]